MSWYYKLQLEELTPDARKNGARDNVTRVSLARPVLSCAHYFQTPATLAI